jgi:mono/diheme cytochrome c family protein
MKFEIKLLSVVLILVTVSAAILTASPTEASAKVAANSASRSVYLSNCARCHGADGRADTESGRLYDVPDISGGRLRRRSAKNLTNVINRGGGSMPAFGKKLTKAQVASLVTYIRKL